MALRRWGRTERSIKETLDLLKNRLDSATYEEDRLDTLSELYTLSLTNPADVGTWCLTSLVKSMKCMDDISYHGKIMKGIFRTDIKKDMVDILCRNRENASIFIERTPAELATLLDSIDSKEFYKFLAQDSEIAHAIILLLKDGRLQVVKKLLQNDEHLCCRVVFEGFMEVILERLMRCKRGRAGVEELNEHYDLLLYLLEASNTSQDYFTKLDLAQAVESSSSISRKDIEIFNAVLNPLSKTYETAQQKLCTTKIITKALDDKMYEFVHNLFNGNSPIFDLLLERHLDFTIILKDSEDSVAALEILESILQSISEIPDVLRDKIASCASYKVNTLLHSLGLQYLDMNGVLEQDLNLGKITLDLVIFVILTRDTIEDIAQCLSYQLFEGTVSDMCLLLHMMHSNDPMPIPVKARLLRLRRFLCQEKVTVDSINEMLISTVGDVIKERTCHFPRRSHSASPIVHGSPVEEVRTEVDSKIKGILDIFRTKDNTQNFDL